MASTFSPNKGYELQATGEDNGIWGLKANAVFSTIDLNFGGDLTKAVGGSSNITVSASEAQNVFHELTGVLTGNIQYILPNDGSFYYLQNSTTGAFTVTACSVLNGTGVVLPAGTITPVFVKDGTTSVVSLVPATGAVAEPKNTIYAGPTSGSDANPAFRALVAADLPAIAADSVMANNTSGSAVPSAVVLSPSQLIGRGATGDVAAITLGTGLSMSGATLNVTAVISGIFPIGSLYWNATDGTNPSALLGFGTWVAVTDKFILAAGSTYTIGTTGGAASTVLATNQIPPLTLSGSVSVPIDTGSSGSTPGALLKNRTTSGSSSFSVSGSTSGGSTPVPTLPPYLVAYCWQRTD